MQTAVALLSVGLLKYDRDPSAVARLLEGMGLGWISQDSISCALSTLTSQFGEDGCCYPLCCKLRAAVAMVPALVPS